MNTQSERQPTVLAIIASPHGIAYALFKGPRVLIETHVYHVNDDKNRKCIVKVRALLAEYQPDILVIEDYTGKGSRRGKRVCHLIRTISLAGAAQAAELHKFSRQQIQERFAAFGVKTRHQIATHLLTWFPKLTPFLPAKRNPWGADNSKLTIFDAVSLAVCYFHDAKW
jgi:Holliday junction resolvasome RuvABC endonuclease subunit